MLPQSFPAVVSIGPAEALPAEKVSRDEPLTRGIALDDLNVAENSSTAETHVIAEMPILKVVSSDHQSFLWWRWWLHNKGVVLVLTSEMFGALMNTATRLLETSRGNAGGMHPFQILLARMTVTFMLSSVYMWYTKVPYFPLGMKEVRRLLLFRGVAGFIGVYGLYYSLQYLPMAEATVITFLVPIITSWACSLLLHEKFSRTQQICGFISLVGIILIACPDLPYLNHLEPPLAPGSTLAATFNSTSQTVNDGPTNSTAVSITPSPSLVSTTTVQRIIAVGIALIGTLGGAGAYTIIRWIGQRAHPLISVNYYAFTCTLISATSLLFIPSIAFELPANFREWMLLSFLGISGFLLQFLLTAGLQADRSSRATNMMYSQMLFALVLEKLVWGSVPGLISIIGGLLILGSTVFVALRKGVSKDEHGIQQAMDEENSLMLNGEDLAREGDED